MIGTRKCMVRCKAVKNMVKADSGLNKKGQGIVEYAILLAFIVGLSVMLQGVGIKDAVAGVFGDVAAVLAGNQEDLSSPEGRQKHDIAAMKKIGEGLTSVFKHKENKKDEFDKVEEPIVMPYNFINVVVLTDGTVDAYIDGSGLGWYSSMSDENKAKYGEQLKQAGIDLTSDSGIEQTKNKLAIASKDDNSLLSNGYAVSFTHYQGEMQLYYKKFNHEATQANYRDGAGRWDRLANPNDNWYATNITDQIN